MALAHLSIAKYGRFFESRLTVDGQTVRTINRPPSIFVRKRDAKAFHDEVAHITGAKGAGVPWGDALTPVQKDQILACMVRYERPYNMA